MNIYRSKQTRKLVSLKFLLLVTVLMSMQLAGNAQGSWIRIAQQSPDFNNGAMILLSDGTVLAKSCHGGIDTIGDLWDRLTPDTNGSYVNGTWSQIAPMKHQRLYCSSQLLKDGRLYVAGGEYGTGDTNGETYDPVTGKWTDNGTMPAGFHIFDGNSELLPDGRVLQGIVYPSNYSSIYNPATNNYIAGPISHYSHDEAAWLKLPDNSILFVGVDSKHSERYIPLLNTWVKDDSLPVALYDDYGSEAGASFLLPDGRAFFIGSSSVTAYYTPSGNNSAGSWAAGPVIPDSFGAPDAAAAMMANGKILCAFSKTPHLADTFPAPTVFYEFDYLTNSFTRVSAPEGGDTMAGSSYLTGMLDLPDGNIMFGTLASNTYYLYVPNGPQVVAGKPVMDKIIKLDCHKYMATGTIFNGISQGAAYGDDWQMPTNYPIVRLSKTNNLYGELVYYARTYNWNSTGVMRGSAADTTMFSLPEGLPDGTYNLEVIANGIHSDVRQFTTCNTVGLAGTSIENSDVSVYPNPTNSEAVVLFATNVGGQFNLKLVDILGRVIRDEDGNSVTGNNTYPLHMEGVNSGVYFIVLKIGSEMNHTRLVVD